jgi:hypothetical protein
LRGGFNSGVKIFVSVHITSFPFPIITTLITSLHCVYRLLLTYLNTHCRSFHVPWFSLLRATSNERIARVYIFIYKHIKNYKNINSKSDPIGCDYQEFNNYVKVEFCNKFRKSPLFLGVRRSAATEAQCYMSISFTHTPVKLERHSNGQNRDKMDYCFQLLHTL